MVAIEGEATVLLFPSLPLKHLIVEVVSRDGEGEDRDEMDRELDKPADLTVDSCWSIPTMPTFFSHLLAVADNLSPLRSTTFGNRKGFTIFPFMQNIIERYKMHHVDLSSNSSPTEQNIQHWKQEAALNAKKIEFLEASKRKLMGENLESCSLEDLNKLEGQLQQGICKIRGIKTQLLSGQLTQLKEKTKVLSEEYELLQNQCKETQEIVDSTRLVALQDNNNQHTDIETDLYIGCPGSGKI